MRDCGGNNRLNRLFNKPYRVYKNGNKMHSTDLWEDNAHYMNKMEGMVVIDSLDGVGVTDHMEHYWLFGLRVLRKNV